MTPEEIQNADDRELLLRRTILLQRPCPSCDQGYYMAPCQCKDDDEELWAIEAELTKRSYP